MGEIVEFSVRFAGVVGGGAQQYCSRNRRERNALSKECMCRVSSDNNEYEDEVVWWWYERSTLQTRRYVRPVAHVMVRYDARSRRSTMAAKTARMADYVCRGKAPLIARIYNWKCDMSRVWKWE